MSEKKSFPIIMQGFSVSAIIAGRKFETRRLTGMKTVNVNPDEWIVSCHGIYTGGNHFIQFAKKDNLSERIEIKSPYGVAGDELWVREACANLNEDFPEQNPYWVYKADLTHEYEHGVVTWRSPMLMPKIANRIILINEGIGIERLQDITEEGAIREGILPLEEGLGRLGYWDKWKDMHGEESWSLNPYLWVLKFTVKSFNN